VVNHAGSSTLKIIRRTVILIVLGMIVSGNLLTFDLAKIRVGSNTLEAIACGYFVASIVLLNLSVAGQAITVSSCWLRTGC